MARLEPWLWALLFLGASGTATAARPHGPAWLVDELVEVHDSWVPERVAVALLLQSSDSFVMTFDPVDDDGNPTGEPRAPSTDQATKQGLVRLVLSLPAGSQVGLWRLDQPQGIALERLEFTDDVRAATRGIDGAGRLCLSNECGCTMGFPPIYTGIGTAIDALSKVDADRRAVVILTDGQDRVLGDPQRTERLVTELTGRAQRAGVEVHAVGYTLDEPEPLDVVRGLAEASGGRFDRVEARPSSLHADARAIIAALQDVGTRFEPRYLVSRTAWTSPARPWPWPGLTIGALLLAAGVVRRLHRRRRGRGWLSALS